MRDGYGIVFNYENLNNSLQITKEFKIINKNYAGHSLNYVSDKLLTKEQFLKHNYAIYIATGAQVPDFINAIIMVEDINITNSINEFKIKEIELSKIKNNQWIIKKIKNYLSLTTLLNCQTLQKWTMLRSRIFVRKSLRRQIMLVKS